MSKPAPPTLSMMAVRFAPELRAIEPLPPAQRQAELAVRLQAVATGPVAPPMAMPSINLTRAAMTANAASVSTIGPAVPGLSCRRMLQLIGAAVTPSSRPLPASGALEF